MFGISRRNKTSKKQPWLYGELELSPQQRQVGYYDKRIFSGANIGELLDNMVKAAADMVDDARKVLTGETSSYLDTDIYLSTEYYHQFYGEEPTETGSGGTTTINNLVSTVAHYRMMSLQHIFVWEDSRRTAARKQSLCPERKTEDAVSTRSLMLASEEDLVNATRFSAVNYLSSWLPVYEAA